MTETPAGTALVTRFDAVLSDLDGVVYAGPHAIPGAVAALRRLGGLGLGLAYVTNNASRTPEQVAAHLRELGAPADDDQVVSSAQAGAALVAERFPEGTRVLVIGSDALRREVTAVGMEIVGHADDKPGVVIQGFDPNLGWHDLAEAAYAINGGAAWVATNTDLTIPRDRGIAPGNGSLVGAVRQAVDVDPLVAGKPEAPLFRTAAARLGATRPLVVGDRLDTDILGGNNAGMATALVLTGVDTALAALSARTAERPDFLLATLDDLYTGYPVVRRDGDAFTCGGAMAVVVDGGLRVGGAADDLDAWRAACAAWWSSTPELAAAAAPTIAWGTVGERQR
ncbi:HAD-IIA family hydrolase [Specibacter cremeus]|uniref:HAD-IIA family hydrolase n=1 Tax=Specibacter cremeus TaxID=1629051 RepID=UPI000F781BBA|nr:HAD-IIA family hydrolase [Specibacter cremeus]